jgi:GTPase SAR1 family protein/predicted regulator of Ras-like GTPase activity (Roadblock/LC7/MglB family)
MPRNRIDIIINEELKNLAPPDPKGIIEGTVSDILDDYQKKISSEEKKIILMGLANAGKTCIYERVFEGKNPSELLRSVATKGILYRGYDIGKFTKPIIWDLGGQRKYLDEYHGPIKEKIFNKAAILLYIVDATDVERFDEARKEFEWAVQQISLTNKKPIIHIFLHKIDLVQRKTETIQYLKQLFTQNLSCKNMVHPTSIYDESLFKGWSEIIRDISDKSTFINTLLKQLKNQDQIKDVLLVLRKNGLAIGSTFDMVEEEIVVGLFSLLITTLERFINEMNYKDIKEFRLKTDEGYLVLTSIDSDQLLAILLKIPTPDEIILKKIDTIILDVSDQIKKVLYA